MNTYREVTGNLNKEEFVQALDKYKLKNTFVVIVEKPFPGYHYHKMDEVDRKRNISIFLVLKKRYTWASIIRATTDINKFLDEPINTSYAELMLFNVPHYAIRIRGLENMNELETIQKAFQDKGFVFMKNKRMRTGRDTFFKVKKFWDIEQVEDGIYKDKNGKYFIFLDKKIEWELFRKMTKDVKLIISDSNFDIVNGAFYMNRRLQDFIRLYKPEITMDLLREVRKEYEKQINKYF